MIKGYLLCKQKQQQKIKNFKTRKNNFVFNFSHRRLVNDKLDTNKKRQLNCFFINLNKTIEMRNTRTQLIHKKKTEKAMKKTKLDYFFLSSWNGNLYLYSQSISLQLLSKSKFFVCSSLSFSHFAQQRKPKIIKNDRKLLQSTLETFNIAIRSKKKKRKKNCSVVILFHNNDFETDNLVEFPIAK